MSGTLLRTLEDRAVLEALEEHQREHATAWTLARGGEVRDEADVFVFITGAPIEWANGAGAARLGRREVDARIRDVRALFEARRVPASWWIGPFSRPGDLGERLRAHGFEPAEELPWMAASLDPPPNPPAVREGFEVRMVQDEVGQAAWLEAMRVGFRQTADQQALLSGTADAIGWSAEGPWVRFACTIDGRPVASSGLLLYGPVAGVYNVATDPAYRRRGLGTVMTTVAMRHAVDLGYHVAVLGASDMGRGVYERLGYRDIFREPRYALRR
jgi:ribosomal protein S18 acetylase RimI-like enzyme